MKVGKNRINETETRTELIDPKLKSCDWGVAEGSRILQERNVCKITDGRIQIKGVAERKLSPEQAFEEADHIIKRARAEMQMRQDKGFIKMPDTP